MPNSDVLMPGFFAFFSVSEHNFTSTWRFKVITGVLVALRSIVPRRPRVRVGLLSSVWYLDLLSSSCLLIASP